MTPYPQRSEAHADVRDNGNQRPHSSSSHVFQQIDAEPSETASDAFFDVEDQTDHESIVSSEFEPSSNLVQATTNDSIDDEFQEIEEADFDEPPWRSTISEPLPATITPPSLLENNLLQVREQDLVTNLLAADGMIIEILLGLESASIQLAVRLRDSEVSWKRFEIRTVNNF